MSAHPSLLWRAFTSLTFVVIACSFGTVAIAQNTDRPELPHGPLRETILLGETLVRQTDTHPLTREFVGNSLQCSSCHLDGGQHPQAATFIGVAAAYPAWAPREQKVITLEDRILNCFLRSQNGTRPAAGSEPSVAIAAYITWLSEGTKLKMNAKQSLSPHHITMLTSPKMPASIDRGKQLYADRCQDCHADNGSGTDDGPAVWGDESYNDGAGLAKVPKLASWLKVAMPPDEADLSVQESFDLAAYLNSHPRPHFEPPALSVPHIETPAAQ
ncbi:MAG: cytochrome C [Rhodopirellula sp. TMED11]|nr:MAG: cytochrome C [Rhodopirellula sp. TMED11]